MRFALVDSEGGESVNVDVALVVEANHMCNKIWNAAKFVHSKPRVSFPSGAKLGAADVWLQGFASFFFFFFLRLCVRIDASDFSARGCSFCC